MTWKAFCLEQADDCEERGDEVAHAEAKAQWRQMAQDWRVAASQQPPDDWREPGAD
jgi:hypothetical protein